MNRDDGFREFVVECSPRLSRSAYLMTGDRQLAEDLLQAALAKTARYWHRIREGNPEGYLRRSRSIGWQKLSSFATAGGVFPVGSIWFATKLLPEASVRPADSADRGPLPWGIRLVMWFGLSVSVGLVAAVWLVVHGVRRRTARRSEAAVDG